MMRMMLYEADMSRVSLDLVKRRLCAQSLPSDAVAGRRAERG